MGPMASSKGVAPGLPFAGVTPLEGPQLAFGPGIKQDRSRSPAAKNGAFAPASGNGLGASINLEALSLSHRAMLDANAEKAVAGLSAEEQKIVMGLVAKQNPRNPSAVTWSMVKMIRDRPMDAKLEYLKAVVDTNATAALEQLPPPEQQAILVQVDVAKCRNVSAFIWSLVKAKNEGTYTGGKMAAARSVATPQPLVA